MMNSQTPSHGRQPSRRQQAPAVVLADGCFATLEGKVAHGLVRGTERFAVRAVIDHTLAGHDAGEVLDGTPAGIPIVTGLARALQVAPDITTAIVGHAPHGGRVTTDLRALLMQAAGTGLHLVNGLHDHLVDDAELAALAAVHGATITDVRRMPPARELRFWDGSVHAVRARRIAVMGTDCAIGKRTTARMLTAELIARGTATEMIYTGQTGWMQGGRYGIIADSLPFDFIGGELERALVTCDQEVDPDVMIIEGQGALRYPAGPFASLMVSAGVCGVVLQHAPARTHYDGLEHLPSARIPSLASEIELIGQYGVPVLAVALNLNGVARSDVDRVISECSAQIGDVPIVTPLDTSLPNIAELADAILGPAGQMAA